MNRLCPTVGIQCALFPGEVDSPILNVSSEAPDLLTFTTVIYDPYDPYHPPVIGDTDLFISHNCYGEVTSTVSQADADRLALLLGRICKQPAAQQFTNDPQTATAICPFSGAIFSYTVPAGTLTVAADPDPEAWIAASNAAALAQAQAQVSQLVHQSCCDTTNLSPHPGWMCLGEELLPGQANTYTITGSLSTDDWQFTVVSGVLPIGVSLVKVSNNSAELQGFPLFAGVYNWSIEAVSLSDPNISITVTDTLAVFGVTNSPLPDGVVDSSYNEQILTSGGVAPITFTFDPLALPSWLTVFDDGTVVGNPTSGDVGTFNFDVTITDDEGKQCVQNIQVTIPASCPDWSTLFWGPDLGSSGGGGTQNSSPTNAAGATFHLDASIAGIFDFAGGQIRATIPYNGPGCNCNLHFSWTENQPHAGAVNNWGISVDVRYGPCPNPAGFRNATDAFGCTTVLLETSAPTSVNPQTVDLPFTIPDTGGSTMYIWLDALIGINGATAGLYTVSMDGTFSNI